MLQHASAVCKSLDTFSKVKLPRISPFLTAAELVKDDGVRATFVSSGMARAPLSEVLGLFLNFEARAFSSVTDVVRRVVQR